VNHTAAHREILSKTERLSVLQPGEKEAPAVALDHCLVDQPKVLDPHSPDEVTERRTVEPPCSLQSLCGLLKTIVPLDGR
jgi:hypothetical protein